MVSLQTGVNFDWSHNGPVLISNGLIADRCWYLIVSIAEVECRPYPCVHTSTRVFRLTKGTYLITDETQLQQIQPYTYIIHKPHFHWCYMRNSKVRVRKTSLHSNNWRMYINTLVYDFVIQHWRKFLLNRSE